MEEEIFLDLRNLSFGHLPLKMALKVLTLHNEQWNLELRENNQILELRENNRVLIVLTKLDFWPFGLENGLEGQF